MSLLHDPNMDRRQFLTKTSLGLGSVALSSLLDPGNLLANIGGSKQAGLGSLPLVPKAKRVIYLFQSGGPSQMELFDYKPLLNERFGQGVAGLYQGWATLTGMTSSQNSFPLAGSVFDFCPIWAKRRLGK